MSGEETGHCTDDTERFEVEVEVTHTGTVHVHAESSDETLKKVHSMSDAEIDRYTNPYESEAKGVYSLD